MATAIVTPRITAKVFEPCITAKVAGEFVCNCQTFMTNAILFDGGSCPHTRAAAMNAQLRDLARANEPKHGTAEYDAWLNEQAAIFERVDFALKVKAAQEVITW
jgi:hypothetical protein